MKPSYIITDDGINGVIDNQLFSVDASHPNISDVINAVRQGDWDEALRFSNLARAVQQFAFGSDIKVDVDVGSVSYNGQELHNTLTQRILSMMGDGFDINPMTNFLRNLMQNPSSRAVDELYSFLEYGNLPITEDGCFIAYKRVADDYYDCHSHTVPAKPTELMTDVERLQYPMKNIGAQKNVTVEIVDDVTTISMPRNGVDDIAANTCSKGLHFCSHEYLKSFSGSRIIIMKINPADVVSIPADYNNTKGRTWKYQVVGELNDDQKRQAESENIFTQSVYCEDDEDDDFGDGSFLDEPYEFVKGYVQGYPDGKGHKTRYLSKAACTESGAGIFEQGYDQGYTDGKNRAPAEYNESDL